MNIILQVKYSLRKNNNTYQEFSLVSSLALSVSLAPTCQPSPNCQSSLTSIASLGQGYYCIRVGVCVSVSLKSRIAYLL